MQMRRRPRRKLRAESSPIGTEIPGGRTNFFPGVTCCFSGCEILNSNNATAFCFIIIKNNTPFANFVISIVLEL